MIQLNKISISNCFLLAFFCLLGACTHQSPEERFDDFRYDLRADYLTYFNMEATLNGDKEAFPLLAIPDSSFLENRSTFISKNKEEIASFKYLLNDYRTQKDEWSQILDALEVDQHEISQELFVFDILPSLEYIMEHPTMSYSKKLSILNHKLRNYPAYLEGVKINISPEHYVQLPAFVDRLSATYFFLKNTIPKELELGKQAEENQISFEKKLTKARLALKDFIAYCNSVSNHGK